MAQSRACFGLNLSGSAHSIELSDSKSGCSPIGEPRRTHNFGRKQIRGMPFIIVRAKRTSRGPGRARVLVMSLSGGDPFETLGVRYGASKNQIKTAYRSLALKYHPDICREDYCQMRFMQVNSAYELALAYISGSGEGFDLDRLTELQEDNIVGDSWEDWEADLDLAFHVSIDNF